MVELKRMVMLIRLVIGRAIRVFMQSQHYETAYQSKPHELEVTKPMVNGVSMMAKTARPLPI